MATKRRIRSSQLLAVLALVSAVQQVAGQLPDDMQRELNQNLAEQARIQAMRARQEQQPGARAGGQGARGRQQQQQQPHDPNNYSYQQVSPPIQYSYYQPYGDAAAQPATGGAGQAKGRSQPINIDLNNLNFDLPTPQAQVADQLAANQQSQQTKQQPLTPSFTGAGGLPVLQPVAAAQQGQPDSFVPAGQAPLAPQARVQQGPPLTEADFKDITGGENYGAPGGSDFGLGEAMGAGRAGSEPASDNTESQLREFGMPEEQPRRRSSQRQSSPFQMADFANFNPMAGGSGSSGQRRGGFDPFGGSGPGQGGGAPGADFDFASQPSSAQGDQTQAAMDGGAPGSLQSLLGGSFPGLASGSGANMGLDGLARGGNGPETQLEQADGGGRADDGALDIADMGDRSDGFSGADLGGFEQPKPPAGDQDFNYVAAAEQQPRSVPYPDNGPQPVGTLWALSQPQSFSQARYSALPDKGTYQDYPAYRAGGNDFGRVAEVVAATPPARRPGAGRYGHPAPSELAPEHRPPAGQPFDYGRSPLAGNEAEAGSLVANELD